MRDGDADDVAEEATFAELSSSLFEHDEHPEREEKITITMTMRDMRK